ncbi:UDP-N-acetylglucosamine diphosphorylase/glucosamine-1-phosphate N-acetyltransferase [Terasakiispira papahanaumokuakeensis]|uniref:Bifunctional protein GlmU n=1 Tax=Terasakiispira papahanaumokuakeensis TaxID=197479 RepID=A0A1E2VD86_9GAMM|nr:bifunctional UDP-N-acetylglucosamine diphosphorylase/glucosamine-1-phosphate N-acetyltransferase GlmU [Terasakiispira papahanaumokuakeensis]ODC04822.1 UDP-N-acetylglucosamine diphosphorylase/glucosamine-1-phosphate N-acetyltransferase [Terasakiispira papahanaumokuakeensis]
MTLDIVILAAGQGTRMRSALPKVLHPLAGRPMIQHVLDAAQPLAPTQIQMVVGHGHEQIRAALAGQAIHFVQQTEQLGTGHAVAQAAPALNDESLVLILYGDVPLIQPRTLQRLLATVDAEHLGLLTVTLDDANGYGRIVRTHEGAVSAIVEHKDATEAQRQIGEINTGILALSSAHLRRFLPQMSNDNAQGEYYLTDIIAWAVTQGLTVNTVSPEAHYEVEGVNNRQQLAQLERVFQQRQAEQLMAQGVTLMDPARMDVRGQLICEQDVVIDVGCVFEGKVVIESGAYIGPYCVIRDSYIAADTYIEAYSHLQGAKTQGKNQVGPFARLRPGAVLAPQAKVGNFVEVKQSHIGTGAKVNHLTYLGDAEVGAHANIGAGTITCNYDGVNKSRTVIGESAFIGSNSSLVAPVSIGDRATVGAGSTITKDVEDDALAVARGRQMQKMGWPRPQKQTDAQER